MPSGIIKLSKCVVFKCVASKPISRLTVSMSMVFQIVCEHLATQCFHEAKLGCFRNKHVILFFLILMWQLTSIENVIKHLEAKLILSVKWVELSSLPAYTACTAFQGFPCKGKQKNLPKCNFRQMCMLPLCIWLYPNSKMLKSRMHKLFHN